MPNPRTDGYTPAGLASPTFTTQITTPIINLTGGQIAFPATAAPSADVNTLDDYEEGDWTAAFTASVSGTITITTTERTGSYVKIGKMVTVVGYFDVVSVSSPVGSLALTGLPFTCANADKFYSAIALSIGTLEAAAITAIQGYVAVNDTKIIIFKYADGVQAALAGDVKAGTNIMIKATYFIS